MKTSPKDRIIRRQKRLLKEIPELPQDAKALKQELRKYMLAAVESEDLKTPHADILKFLKMEPNHPKDGARVAITGGDIDNKRTGAKNHFTTKNDAWFDFSITVEQKKGSLTLISYRFEIRLGKRESIDFLRFDLNQPGHKNDELGVRAHLHMSLEHIHVPSSIFSPLELLEFFIYEFRSREDEK